MEERNSDICLTILVVIVATERLVAVTSQKWRTVTNKREMMESD
jgi:hypothetical protein